MREIYSMTAADVDTLLWVADDRLEGHQFDEAERLYRRAWYAHVLHRSGVKVTARSFKGRSLLGLARTFWLRARSRTTTKDAALMLRSLTLFQRSDSIDTPERRRLLKSLKSLVRRELDADPDWLSALLEASASIRCQRDLDGATPLIKVPDTPTESISTSDSTNESITSDTLDKMRDSIHVLVRQLSSKTRKASNRKQVPEEMLRESVSSSLITLQCRDDMPEELQCFSDKPRPLKCKLKRHSSEASYYNKSKPVILRRQHSFDYSPNNLIGNQRVKRSYTLPSQCKQTPRAPRTEDKSTKDGGEEEDEAAEQEEEDISEDVMEIWTRVKAVSLPNGVSFCKPEIAVCQRSTTDFLDNIGLHERLTLTNLLLDIRNETAPPSGNRRTKLSGVALRHALMTSLNGFAAHEVCECTTAALLKLVRALACSCADHLIGERLLEDHDEAMTSLSDLRLRPFNGEFACVTWREWAASRAERSAPNTLHRLHDLVRHYVDTSLPPQEPDPASQRIADYLRTAYGYATCRQRPELAALLGDRLLVNGGVDQAVDYLEEAAAGCDDLIVRARALCGLASALFMQTKYTRAQRLFETAHSLFQNSIVQHEEEVAYTRAMISLCLHETGQHRNTILWALRSLHLYDHVFGNGYASMPAARRWFIVRCLYISAFTYCYIEFYEKSLNMLEHCYNTIVEGTDDMHTMLLLRTIGDVMSYKNMEDGEDKEELIDKTASIYGHALRYSKSDADRFQIHDRLAALKVNAADYVGAGEDLDAALRSQLNVQRGIASSLASTLDRLAGTFAMAGDLTAAADCAAESLTAGQRDAGSWVGEDSGRGQRARTLRRLAALTSDHSRAENYYEQAVDLDPSARVHYAGYLHRRRRYYDALLALLPFVTSRPRASREDSFDLVSVPDELKADWSSSSTYSDEETVRLDALQYALYLATDCYRRVQFVDEYCRCFNDLRDLAVEVNTPAGLLMVARAALMAHDYCTAAQFFANSWWLRADSTVAYNYWMCTCLGTLQRVAELVMALPLVSNTDLSEQVECSDDVTTQDTVECSDSVFDTTPVTEPCNDSDSTPFTDSDTTPITVVYSEPIRNNRTSFSSIIEEDEDSLDEESSSCSVQGQSNTSYSDSLKESSVSQDSLDESGMDDSGGDSTSGRVLPDSLALQSNDTWQHVEEVTITTPDVILEALRKLHLEKETNCSKSQPKISENSELSNFEITDEADEEEEDEEEEEIFHTWEEYTEYTDVNETSLKEDASPVTIENKMEDKGYNSDSEWVTSEEIVDTPFVIMQALKNNQPIH